MEVLGCSTTGRAIIFVCGRVVEVVSYLKPYHGKLLLVLILVSQSLRE